MTSTCIFNKTNTHLFELKVTVSMSPLMKKQLKVEFLAKQTSLSYLEYTYAPT